MWTIMIWLLFAVESATDLAIRDEAIRPKVAAGTCVDEEIGLKCDAFCYADYIDCKNNCQDSGCERVCLSEYTRCYEDCPCFSNCLDGCLGCPNPICSCSSPQTSNPYFKQCVKEANQNFSNCTEICGPGTKCYDECIDGFRAATNMCPCNDGCPKGCPCDNGFICQPYITAMCDYTDDYSFIISGDGKYQENRYYQSPNNQLYGSAFAILNDEVYIFGSNVASARNRISKIVGCSIIELEIKLLRDVYADYSSLVTVPEIKDEVVICGGFDKSCESFDGENSIILSSTKVLHKRGCMALYEGQATLVGGETSRVEALALSGWQDEPSHPVSNVQRQACVSVSNGIISAGGYDGSNDIKDVYLFRKEEWTVVGQLKEDHRDATMIAFDYFFMVFSGITSPYSVERADWNGNQVTSSEVLRNTTTCYRPIVFETLPNQCEDFCSQDFCFV
ncbi:unnamed protein product [Oikopleura dioica]|uniref:Uncharacterized protein n=1 Tax=Oikopleura dioica TaxID=34765 RepID=E4XMH7_OIKDI|nr:unnamed protein product [Oikopleura dioica]